MSLFLALVVAPALAFSAQEGHGEDHDPALERMAFGSCYGTDGSPEIWSVVEEYAPDALLLLGDNVYGDTEDMDVLRGKYAALDAVPAFARLREEAALLAVWDDHDYGENDAGAAYPMRAQSQQVFLDFLRVPPGDPRRAREGTYDAPVFGPPGRRVQFLLLDTRYHRSPLVKAPNTDPLSAGRPGSYVPSNDPSATVLGEAQWAWLERALTVPAELRVLATSIQLVAEDHRFEGWRNFPSERRRLLETIRRTRANGVVVVSGDRHIGEISVLDPGRAAEGSACDVGYPLVDVTASSFNRPSSWRNERNRHRVGSILFDVNFGSIEVDWESGAVVLAVRNGSGREALRYETSLEALRP